MEIKKMKLKDLVSPDWNPRTISNEELRKLRKSIEEFGYSDPLIINKRNNHIVAGNQRFKILKELNKSKDYNFDEIDCVIVDLEDYKEKTFNIAHNKIDGEFDDDKLQIVLQEIELSSFDIDLTGFNKVELEPYLENLEIKEISEPKKEIVEEKVETKTTTTKTESTVKKTTNPQTFKEDIIKNTIPQKEEPTIGEDEEIEQENEFVEEFDDIVEESEPVVEENIVEDDDLIEEEDYVEDNIYEDEPEDIVEEPVQTKQRRPINVPEPNYIPVAPIKRIIKDSGAERVSDNAAKLLANVLEENARQISEKAVMMANVAGRKTIVDEDFEIILKN